MYIYVYLHHVLVHELVLLAHPLRRVLARLAPHQGVLELLDHVPVQVLAVCVCERERVSECVSVCLVGDDESLYFICRLS